MSLLSRVFHSAIQLYQKKSHSVFVAGLNQLEKVQLAKLQATLKFLSPLHPAAASVSDYATFTERFPVTAYSDYQDLFHSEKTGQTQKLPEVVRFQPTSGSTNAIKWIPYTAPLLKDFDAALGPWLYDFYKNTPGVLAGPHYWSFSWLPEDLRKEGLKLDDTELFPFWKRLLLKKTMAVIEPVDRTPTSEMSMFATAVYLANQEHLSFVSVWSPTYWLNLVQFLETHREAVQKSLATGRWQLFEKGFANLRCPQNQAQAKRLRECSDVVDLWPKLKALSAWNTSTSAAFAAQIESRWPRIQVYGKGLWATEACVTIPFQGQYVLASQSHFFEFEDAQTGKISPSWELQEGQLVSPVVTTTGGLIRYKMQDTLRVTGFIEKTPCFEFLGRADGIDMVGEKTSSLRAQEVLQKLAPTSQESFLFAVKGDENYYCALLPVGTDADSSETYQLAKNLEELLSESFHYRVARELGQLAPARVQLTEKPLHSYTKLHLNRGMVLGNIKLEALRLVAEHELKESLQCH